MVTAGMLFIIPLLELEITCRGQAGAEATTAMLAETIERVYIHQPW